MSSPPTPYPPNQAHPIPARSGVAVPLQPNQIIHIINTHGTQVIDFFAFVSSHPTNIEKLSWSHHLSMSHTRASTCHLSPLVGDILTTTQRHPIFEVVSDDSGGVHDTLIAACDLYRYQELDDGGREEGYYHDSCADNLIKGLIRDLGLESEDVPGEFVTPQPLNLFMNIPVHFKTDEHGRGVSVEVSPSAGADLSFEKPVSKRGTGVRLKALQGCVVVMSACPQDLLDINCREPRECEFVIEDA